MNVNGEQLEWSSGTTRKSVWSVEGEDILEEMSVSPEDIRNPDLFGGVAISEIEIYSMLSQFNRLVHSRQHDDRKHTEYVNICITRFM